MQEIITINGKKYIEYIEPNKEYKRWRAEKGEIYYVISIIGDVVYNTDDYNEIDEFNFNIDNYFKTEEEAIKERDKRLAVVRVNDAILSLNEGWEPDWGNVGEYKYFIFINSFDNTISFDYNTHYKNSYNLAYMKSEEIAQKMIKEHEEDLKLIFDIICKSL